MATTTSFLDWLLDLLRDPEARAAFLADPDDYLRDHGYGDLSSADVHDALCLISDNDHQSNSDHGVHYPPPHHYDHDHDGGDAGHYLRNYITNNYTVIDQHNTYVDDSVHQNIDTHGGDFDQHIDNDPVIASGDGAVAAGGDIRDSTVTIGDGNVVGDHNQAVTGDHDTTSFGSGNATSADLGNSHFADGGALSVGGDARGESTDNDTRTSVHNSGSGDTSVNAAGSHGDANQHADQHESDDSTHTNYEDHSYTDSHDVVNSHNHVQADDSHDTDVHH
jgi:hypothetical protein